MNTTQTAGEFPILKMCPAIFLPSLLLQMLLCGHQWILHGFVLLSASLFAFKRVVLETLSFGQVVGGTVFLAFYVILENMRLRQNSKGNKTKKRAPLLLAIALAAPAFVSNICFLRLQPHILDVEIAINCIAIFLQCMEVLFGSLTLLWLVKKSSTYDSVASHR